MPFAPAPSAPDPGVLNAWLILAIMPITSVLTLVINHLFSRRKTKSEVDVAKITSRTGEMDVAFDGLTANINSMADQLKELRGELRDTKADARRTQDELNLTRSDLRKLEGVVSDFRVERALFIAHVALLESLVPSPPGPPPRPNWIDRDPGAGTS